MSKKRSDVTVTFVVERRRGGESRGMLATEFWVQTGPCADFEGVRGHIWVVVEEHIHIG